MAQRAHTEIEPRIVTQVPGASCDWTSDVDGIPVEFVRVPDRLRAATLFQFDKRKLSDRVLSRNPDIVHAHGTEEAYAMAAQATGKPYLITLQGVFALINRELPPRIVSRERVVEFLEARTLRRARHVIAKSEYIGDRVGKIFPDLLIHRIPNTFDPRLLEIDTTKTPRSVCFVGMVTERKGLDLVAKALRFISEQSYPAEFHIVGNRGGGAAEYDRRVLGDLRKLLGSRLVLHGILPALETAKIVARCEVLVAPSREEMFGNQLIEALLLKTLPVVSEGTALAENVIRFGAGKTLAQGDVVSLAAALQTPGPANHCEEIEKARARVCDWMGPRAVALKHRCLYEAVLAERN